jgi:4-amino-4-deoxy-L-arabinose transferase-like glycosyltransferase
LSAAGGSRDWRALLALVAVPVLLVGLFARSYYTPDEPREASLALSMAHQAQRVVPELGGQYFLEKPPLTYWLAGASIRALGASPASARLPGLAYALLAIAALAALATRAAGPRSGLVAGLVTATALILYQVEIWLATDALLLAGVALSLYGLYRAWLGDTPRERYAGYAWFHAGLVLAFYAKNFAGWMVPVLALLTLVVLERRWRALIAVELWAFVPATVLAIGVWVAAVARLPDGAAALRVLFWHNLVGRAMPVAAEAQFAYATGHVNYPGKYLVELPVYLLPWTPLAVAALRNAVRSWRSSGPLGSAWRLALGAIVPATLLLSIAATARGIYYGPCALGFALLIGLWARGPHDLFDRAALACTAILVALLALICGALAALTAFAPRAAPWVGAGSLALLATAAAMVLSGAAARAAARKGTATDIGAALAPLALATGLTLSLIVLPLYLRLNSWMDLRVAATPLYAAAGHRPLIVFHPDETTEAMVALYPPAAPVIAVIRSTDAESAAAAGQQLRAQPDAALLYLVPGRAQWGLKRWLEFLGYRRGESRPAGPPSLPSGMPALELRCLVTRAGGRAYALYVLASSGAEPAAALRSADCPPEHAS